MESDEHKRLVEVFRALSNPNRFTIFERIRELSERSPDRCAMDEECCVSAIGGALDMAPSTLSEHLKELKRAGLIVMSKRGRLVHCRVAPKALADLESFARGRP